MKKAVLGALSTLLVAGHIMAQGPSGMIVSSNQSDELSGEEYCEQYLGGYIGTISMKEDGVLHLSLIGCDPTTRAIGHAFMAIGKDDPRYQYFIDHAGGLSVGETKRMPAFPPLDNG